MSLITLAPALLGLQLGLRHPPSRQDQRLTNVQMGDPWGASSAIDPALVQGGAAALLGLGTGVGLIVFTEQQGVAEKGNDQVCVECKGEQVVTCTICGGTGVDKFASLASEVSEARGVATASNVIEVDDWAGGPKTVVMYEDILAKFPIKATENVCLNCEGRGVVVCDNCKGTGIQPKFLERYSPDDFMD